jgi:MFS family permease
MAPTSRWRQPVAPIYVATLVLCLGKGAWFACYAMFLTRSVGLSPAEFGIGVTVSGLVGLLIGGPLGYLSDRIGARETLIRVAILQGLAVLSFAVVSDLWTVMIATCVTIACERSVPGIRTALVSGLTESGPERIRSISMTNVMSQGGLVVGALFGAVVLSLDSRPGYLALVLAYAVANFGFAVLLVRVPHVEGLRAKKITRKVLVLRDRPYLALTAFNGIMALNWGMLDIGVPLWITYHTDAPVWMMGLLMGFNATIMALFMNRVSRRGETVATAGRLGVLSGLILALSCAAFAATAGASGAFVIVVLVVAATIHVIGELFFVAAGLGLSVGLTPDDAHGEYQGMFSTGQVAALMLAPGIMTGLLVGLGVAGWFVLAAMYLVSGFGMVAISRRATHHHPAPAVVVEQKPEPEAEAA